jgi:hypothetical protein
MSPDVALMKELRAYRHAQHVANGTDRFHVSQRQKRKARSIARQMADTKQGRQETAARITAALAAFGGHITGFSPAQ